MGLTQPSIIEVGSRGRFGYDDVSPPVTPDPPTLGAVTEGDGTLSVPAAPAGPTDVVWYMYRMAVEGADWSVPTTAVGGAISLSGLPNEVRHEILAYAVSSGGLNSLAAEPVYGTPTAGAVDAAYYRVKQIIQKPESGTKRLVLEKLDKPINT